MKARLTFSQIINMNVGFLGIQYSFGLQQSAINPIYDFLGASPDEIPWLNLAGPMTGLLVQPIIGALSDKTYHPRWGRRKPYFLIGAILCSICLFLFPFSSSLWMAAGLLWILDAGNNTAMEPYRAFVADKLDESQQGKGFLTQSFFTGLGQTLANLSLFIFPIFILGKTGKIPNWVFASFFLGGVCSIVSIWWSLKTTKEDALSDEEVAVIRAQPLNIFSPFIDVFEAIKNMPKVMWMLAIVYMFQWYALFCYWQNSSKAVAINSYGWQYKELDKSLENSYKNYEIFKKSVAEHALANKMVVNDVVNEKISAIDLFTKWKDVVKHDGLTEADVMNITPHDDNNRNYASAVSHTGLVNAWYNFITFVVALFLVGLAKRYGSSKVHAFCLLLAGLGFIWFSQIHDKSLYFVAIAGFGIGWASMMGIPYLMVVNQIPKEKYGVYMVIINMMIVIPMLIQTMTFGYIMKNFFNNDSTTAIMFAGVLLIIASLLTIILIGNKQNEPVAE